MADTISKYDPSLGQRFQRYLEQLQLQVEEGGGNAQHFAEEARIFGCRVKC